MAALLRKSLKMRSCKYLRGFYRSLKGVSTHSPKEGSGSLKVKMTLSTLR